MDKIINYKCRFRGRKKGNNFFPFSSELFLRWGEVGRIVDISLPPPPPPLSFPKGDGKGVYGGRGLKVCPPFSKGFLFVSRRRWEV
jgi:hypothetical protein